MYLQWMKKTAIFIFRQVYHTDFLCQVKEGITLRYICGFSMKQRFYQLNIVDPLWVYASARVSITMIAKNRLLTMFPFFTY